MRFENTIPLFPLGLVLLPHMHLPLHIFEERYKVMINECLVHNMDFGIVYQREVDIKRIGCTARIVDVLRSYEDGRLDILTLGISRFRVESFDQSRPFLQGKITYFEDDPRDHWTGLTGDAAKLLAQLDRLTGKDAEKNPNRSVDPAAVSFLVAGHDVFTFDEKQEFLEITSTASRLRKESIALERALERFKTREEMQQIVGGNGKIPKPLRDRIQ